MTWCQFTVVLGSSEREGRQRNRDRSKDDYDETESRNRDRGDHMEGGTGEDTMILIGVGSVTVIAATSSMQLLISEQYCHHWVLRL